MNLTNYKISPLHEIFDTACIEAEKRGLRLTASEIVGLIPYDAMKDAAQHYHSACILTYGVRSTAQVTCSRQATHANRLALMGFEC